MSEKNHIDVGGRPPKDPEEKVSIPARALLTIGVTEALQESSGIHGIPLPSRGRIPSDIVRLGIYMLLDKDGLLDKNKLREDPTWDTLREKGLV